MTQGNWKLSLLQLVKFHGSKESKIKGLRVDFEFGAKLGFRLISGVFRVKDSENDNHFGLW